MSNSFEVRSNFDAGTGMGPAGRPIDSALVLYYFFFFLFPSPFDCASRVLGRNMVVDTRYYDILQIKADADELTIKKVLCFLLALSFKADLLFCFVGIPTSSYFGTLHFYLTWGFTF